MLRHVLALLALCLPAFAETPAWMALSTETLPGGLARSPDWRAATFVLTQTATGAEVTPAPRPLPPNFSIDGTGRPADPGILPPVQMETRLAVEGRQAFVVLRPDAGYALCHFAPITPERGQQWLEFIVTRQRADLRSILAAKAENASVTLFISEVRANAANLVGCDTTIRTVYPWPN